MPRTRTPIYVIRSDDEARVLQYIGQRGGVDWNHGRVYSVIRRPGFANRLEPYSIPPSEMDTHVYRASLEELKEQGFVQLFRSGNWVAKLTTQGREALLDWVDVFLPYDLLSADHNDPGRPNWEPREHPGAFL